MQSLRRAATSLIVPGIALLHCLCVCSPSVAAQPERAPSPLHDCHGGSRDPSHQRPAQDHSSRACPHCDNAQVAKAETDGDAATAAAAQFVAAATLLDLLPAGGSGATLRFPHQFAHSPPALSLLLQKCVLLI